MDIAFENGAYFRFLDEIEETGMLDKIDDLHGQLREKGYVAMPDETITVSVESEAYAYHFYFDVRAYEDMGEAYIDMEKQPMMLCYRFNTIHER